jgi:hypothetical protein
MFNGGVGGSAYLYSTSGQLLQTFADPNNSTSDAFGYSVSLSGSNVLVGAFGINGGKGAAYLYSTSGQLLQIFTDPNNTTSDYFGSSVALSDSNVLVGAYDVNSGKGAAYLYSTSGQLIQTFTDPNNTAFDNFGVSVALSGSNVLVGADGVNNGAGATYLYSMSGQLLQTLTDPNNTVFDNFGVSMALSGSNVLVGADRASGEGAAYEYAVASSLSTLEGNNQSTVVGSAFGTPLEVQVRDSSGNPVSGASVIFTESNGASGAGATFTGNTTIVQQSGGGRRANLDRRRHGWKFDRDGHPGESLHHLPPEQSQQLGCQH